MAEQVSCHPDKPSSSSFILLFSSFWSQCSSLETPFPESSKQRRPTPGSCPSSVAASSGDKLMHAMNSTPGPTECATAVVSETPATSGCLCKWYDLIAGTICRAVLITTAVMLNKCYGLSACSTPWLGAIRVSSGPWQSVELFGCYE